MVGAAKTTRIRVKYRRSPYDGGWNGPDFTVVNYLNNKFDWSKFNRPKKEAKVINTDDLIKVHVTREQQDDLLMMVNRRINDIINHRSMLAVPMSDQLKAERARELVRLQALKKELWEAGS